jgi:hypothetical protein
MYARTTTKQFNTTTEEVKLMKRAFTTKWDIYRVCIPALEETKMQCEDGEEVSTLEEPSACNRCFEELLLEALDEELSLLGESVKQAVYHNLKKTFKIDKHTIPHRIDHFAAALEKMFGHGAKLLEIQIMKRLYRKVGHNIEYFPESADLLFIKYVEAAKCSNHR